ncbi:pilus assembly protein PilM [Domibacillus sp. A3M-37]|uniref:type IV pilus biogenesis protein PilM n=1 Tax=Domibacillus sp. A3M-37 TaxID=2962037 RepID=UPI0020B7219A|nr:pilus assembly protein PilM [Domibacillus sp. A3M-37]MCP3762582.1 pilus assembly protein PilM [Domibacillus sp. A3M-37]
MALRLFQKKDKTINFTITDEAIRFVELRQSDPLLIEKFGERKLPEGMIVRGDIVKIGELQDVIDNMVDEWKLKNRNIRFTIPDRYVAIREEKVDRDLTLDEIKNFFFMQIGSTIHLPFDEPVFDVVVTGYEENKQSVLLVAAPEQVVEDYAGVFEHARLKPIAADIAPLALYRLFHSFDRTNDSAHELLIHLKSNVMTLSIFHGHQLKFMKPVFIEKSEDVLDMEDADGSGDLADALSELDKVVNFYENSVHGGQVKIERILFTGDHPQRPFVEEFINKSFDIPVETDEQMKMDTKQNEWLPPAFLAAVGLALKDG